MPRAGDGIAAFMAGRAIKTLTAPLWPGWPLLPAKKKPPAILRSAPKPMNRPRRHVAFGVSELQTARLAFALARNGRRAGLNLFFDLFHYRLATDRGDMDWGRAYSPLSLVKMARHAAGWPMKLRFRGAGAVVLVYLMQMNA